MYIKLKDYDGTFNDGDIILMSHKEFVDGGKKIKGVPIAVTPNGDKPIEFDEELGDEMKFNRFLT